MDKKLLVLDIDGTLVNNKKEITPKTKEALLKAQDAGHIVMLGSGRPTPGLMKNAELLELEKRGGYLLSFNGGKVSKAGSDEIIYQSTLPNEYIKIVYDFACEKDLGLVTYRDNDVICARRPDEYLEFEARLNGMNLVCVDNFVDYVNFPVNKCLISADPDKSFDLMNELQERCGDKLNIGRSEAFFIEVTSPGVDKADTIEKILPILGISRENTICCGDGFNDKTMIEFAGLGVAMANAKEEVKAAADYITSSNEEDGIAEVVYKFVL